MFSVLFYLPLVVSLLFRASDNHSRAPGKNTKSRDQPVWRNSHRNGFVTDLDHIS